MRKLEEGQTGQGLVFKNACVALTPVQPPRGNINFPTDAAERYKLNPWHTATCKTGPFKGPVTSGNCSTSRPHHFEP